MKTKFLVILFSVFIIGIASAQRTTVPEDLQITKVELGTDADSIGVLDSKRVFKYIPQTTLLDRAELQIQPKLDLKADLADVNSHILNTNNPHDVTKTQVGLSNVENTSDADKPISTATQGALDTKISNSEKGAPNGVATLLGDGKIPLSQTSDALQGSFLDKVFNDNPLSYKYMFRDANYLNFIYVYGDKAIVYEMAIENSSYLWVRSVWLQDVGLDGLADGSKTNEITRKVQEYAIRYRKSGTLDPTIWTPYHGATSAITDLESLEIDIDGIKYNYTNIPLNTNWRFDKINILQELSVKYDLASTVQMNISLTHVFDEKQLHFQNTYKIIEDIDVQRAYGSRLSLNNCDSISIDNGFKLISIADNENTFGFDAIYSAKSESTDVTGANQLGNFRENTSYGKPYINENQKWQIWDRNTGGITLYFSMVRRGEDDNDLTTIPAGEVLNSSNNVLYVPKMYGNNDIDVKIGKSPGLKREFSNNKGLTFATLPVSPNNGDIATITDAMNVVSGGNAAGGGSETALVVYDGTNWVYSGGSGLPAGFYEEGTFTPVISGYTFTIDDAEYIRAGNSVTITFVLSNVNGSGIIDVTGMPFTTVGSDNYGGNIFSFINSNLTSSDITRLSIKSKSGTNGLLIKYIDSTVIPSTISLTNGVISCSITYKTNVYTP